MALDKPGGGGQNRRPSLRGSIINRVQRGQEVVVAWPKKASKKRRLLQRDREEFFRQVQWAWKFTDPNFVTTLTQAVKGTPLLPRDLFLSQLSGRLLAMRDPDGRLMVSVSAQSNVSETLDFISSEPGAILFRGEEGWMGLAPGDPGTFLQMPGVGPQFPEWGAGGSGGGVTDLIPQWNPGMLRFTTSTNVTASTALVLTHVNLPNDLTVKRIKLPTRSNPSGTWRGVIYDWAAIDTLPQATTGATLIATSNGKTIPAGNNVIDLDFPAPVDLPGGRIYLVGWHRTSNASQLSCVTNALAPTVYTTTTQSALPPAVLPALTIATSAAVSFWTENV